MFKVGILCSLYHMLCYTVYGCTDMSITFWRNLQEIIGQLGKITHQQSENPGWSLADKYVSSCLLNTLLTLVFAARTVLIIRNLLGRKDIITIKWRYLVYCSLWLKQDFSWWFPNYQSSVLIRAKQEQFHIVHWCDKL